jgi:hypothetical protein
VIPHGSYLKEHCAFMEEDLPRAMEVLRGYIAECRRSLDG